MFRGRWKGFPHEKDARLGNQESEIASGHHENRIGAKDRGKPKKRGLLGEGSKIPRNEANPAPMQYPWEERQRFPRLQNRGQELAKNAWKEESNQPSVFL